MDDTADAKMPLHPYRNIGRATWSSLLRILLG